MRAGTLRGREAPCVDCFPCCVFVFVFDLIHVQFELIIYALLKGFVYVVLKGDVSTDPLGSGV